MAAFVTLAEAKANLRVVDTDDDDMLVRQIENASATVLEFLKLVPSPEWDVDTVPEQVRQATILVLKAMYDGESDILSGLGTGDPANPIVALLYRLRDPAVA